VNRFLSGLRAGTRGVWRGSRSKLFGLAFLGVVGGLIALSIAAYDKAFTDVTPVTLQADRIGNQLSQNADVKLRGLLVGEVRQVRSTGTGAVLQLALHPEDTKLIPANVQARIMPKTLFGEKFVDLVIPPGESAAAAPIRAGDVIPQDRSQTAIELGKVFDDLVPVLRAVQPTKLNTTLNSIATALHGRGDALGGNLTRADTYFKQFNPALDDLSADISKLADLADNLNVAAPDFLRMLSNSSAVSTNVVREQDQLESFLRGTAGFAGTATRVLARNERDLVRVGSVGRPTLETLRDNGQQLPFIFQGLTALTPRVNDALGGQGPFLHITALFVRDRGPYTLPTDCPRYPGAAGPNCPDYRKGAPNGAVQATGYDALVDPSGSAAEQERVAGLVGPASGLDPAAVPGLADVLFGPVLRGTEVTLS